MQLCRWFFCVRSWSLEVPDANKPRNKVELCKLAEKTCQREKRKVCDWSEGGSAEWLTEPGRRVRRSWATSQTQTQTWSSSSMTRLCWMFVGLRWSVWMCEGLCDMPKGGFSEQQHGFPSQGSSGYLHQEPSGWFWDPFKSWRWNLWWSLQGQSPLLLFIHTKNVDSIFIRISKKPWLEVRQWFLKWFKQGWFLTDTISSQTFFILYAFVVAHFTLNSLKTEVFILSFLPIWKEIHCRIQLLL